MAHSAPDIVVFTEGGRQTGFGHVVRCSAFAAATASMGKTTHFVIHGDEGAGAMLHDFSWELADWAANPSAIAAKIPADALVFIDSYLAPIEVIDWFQQHFLRTVVLDDNARLQYERGTVVSPTNFWHLLDWNQSDAVNYVFGAEYVLLRQPFWKAAPISIQPKIKTVLITLGGSFLADGIGCIMQQLCSDYPAWKKIVLGGNEQTLKAANGWDENTEVRTGISASEMCVLMQSCDLAISAAGQTSYELARLGIPSAIISLAANQDKCVDAFVAQGFQLTPLKWEAHDLMTDLAETLKAMQNQVVRKKLSAAGQQIIDGQGASRMAKKLLTINR